MATKVRKVQYYYANVRGEPDEAFDALTQLAAQGVNLLALNSVPIGPDSTQFTLFPEDSAKLADTAKAAGISLEGPHQALLVQGDDEIGAVARVHGKLHKSGVEVYASNAVTDGRGWFGYVIYLRAGEADRAVAALNE